MNRTNHLSRVFLLAAAAAAAGCQGAPDDDATSAEPIGTVDRIDIGEVVLAASEHTRYDASIDLWRDGRVKDRAPAPSVSVRIAPDGDERVVDVDGDDARLRGTFRARADGALAGPRTVEGAAAAAEDTGRPPGVDLLDALPRAGTSLARGVTYTSAPVSEGYVRANHARGTMTMTQRIESTPIELWDRGDVAVVRVSTRAVNVIAWIDEQGGFRHGEMGVAAHGFIDLVRLGDDGWRVLRLTRISPVDQQPALDSYAELRAADHLEFTACLTGTSLGRAADLHRLAPGIPAFDKCR